MKQARAIILAFTTALAVPALAAAQQAPEKAPPAMDQTMKADCPYMSMGMGWGKGQKPMTQEEFDAKIAAAYKDADSRKDGKVTLEEFRSHMERERDRRRAEREAEMFKRFDSNNDGNLSAEEFKAGAERMRQKMEHRHHDGRKWHKGMRDGMGPHGPGMMQAPATDKPAADKP